MDEWTERQTDSDGVAVHRDKLYFIHFFLWTHFIPTNTYIYQNRRAFGEKKFMTINKRQPCVN